MNISLFGKKVQSKGSSFLEEIKKKLPDRSKISKSDYNLNEDYKKIKDFINTTNTTNTTNTKLDEEDIKKYKIKKISEYHKEFVKHKISDITSLFEKYLSLYKDSSDKDIIIEIINNLSNDYYSKIFSTFTTTSTIKKQIFDIKNKLEKIEKIINIYKEISNDPENIFNNNLYKYYKELLNLIKEKLKLYGINPNIKSSVDISLDILVGNNSQKKLYNFIRPKLQESNYTSIYETKQKNTKNIKFINYSVIDNKKFIGIIDTLDYSKINRTNINKISDKTESLYNNIIKNSEQLKIFNKFILSKLPNFMFYYRNMVIKEKYDRDYINYINFVKIFMLIWIMNKIFVILKEKKEISINNNTNLILAHANKYINKLMYKNTNNEIKNNEIKNNEIKNNTINIDISLCKYILFDELKKKLTTKINYLLESPNNKEIEIKIKIRIILYKFIKDLKKIFTTHIVNYTKFDQKNFHDKINEQIIQKNSKKTICELIQNLP